MVVAASRGVPRQLLRAMISDGALKGREFVQR